MKITLLSPSIILVLLAELPEINLCMTQSTVFKIAAFHFAFVHFVAAGFATVIVSRRDGLPRNHAGWEVAPARTATGVILAYGILASLSWALYPFPRGLLGSVLGEDAYGHFCVSLSLFRSSHSFKLHKSPGTFLITLNNG